MQDIRIHRFHLFYYFFPRRIFLLYCTQLLTPLQLYCVVTWNFICISGSQVFHLLPYSFNMLHGIFCHCSLRSFHYRFVTSDSLNRIVCRVGKYTSINTMYKDTFYFLPMVAVYICIDIFHCAFVLFWCRLVSLSIRVTGMNWFNTIATARARTVHCVSRQSIGWWKMDINYRCEIWGSHRGEYE
jgi:hypothetical protein